MLHDSMELARLSRIDALKICSKAGASHIASSLSVIDILAVLYSGGANISPEQATDSTRDVIILSKGHAAAALYAVLVHAGFQSPKELDTYCANGTQLGAHVTVGSIKGVEVSTGSLGHGLPIGVGLALAAKRQANTRDVYVILSDGECDEGSNWEAALVAGHHELESLIVLIDRNRLQSLTGTEQTLRLEPLGDKWEAFGWAVQQVDGHDHIQIKSAIDVAQAQSCPSVIICNTTKGKGVSFMENQVAWHYKSPNQTELTAALNEICQGKVHEE